jgi:hypothetical protein
VNKDSQISDHKMLVQSGNHAYMNLLHAYTKLAAKAKGLRSDSHFLHICTWNWFIALDMHMTHSFLLSHRLCYPLMEYHHHGDLEQLVTEQPLALVDPLWVNRVPL